MAGNNGPFGFDPDDFDRFAREAGDGLRDMVGRFLDTPGGVSAFSAIFDQGGGQRTRARRPEPETTGETGSGVWAVFVTDVDGGARVEQVFATEIDALRANQRNTDPHRRVRFLPYGIAVSALDIAVPSDDAIAGPVDDSGSGSAGESNPDT